MNSKLAEILERRAKLVERAAQQREHFAHLWEQACYQHRFTLQTVETAWTLSRFIKRHPLLTALGSALMYRVQGWVLPMWATRWAGYLTSLMQGFQYARQFLGAFRSSKG